MTVGSNSYAREIWKPVYDALQTTDAFPTVVPANASVGTVPLDNESVALLFFGTGADNSTFAYRVYGVSAAGEQKFGTGGILAVPVLLAQGVATLSAVVGVEGTTVPNTNRFADTLTVTFPASGDTGSVRLLSPTGDLSPAMLVIDNRGFSKIHVTFDLTGATGANALARTV